MSSDQNFETFLLISSKEFLIFSKDKTNNKKVEGARSVAAKCDMCKDVEGGASCVSACPTGAAIRVNPEEFLSITNLAKSG